MQVEVDIERATRISRIVDSTSIWILVPLLYLGLTHTDLGRKIGMIYAHGAQEPLNLWAKFSAALLVYLVLRYGIELIYSLWIRTLFPGVHACMRERKGRVSDIVTYASSKGFFWLGIVSLFSFAMFGLSFGVCALFENQGLHSGWPYFLWTAQVIGIGIFMSYPNRSESQVQPA